MNLKNKISIPDLAVGAYRSGEVFLFYGLSIIDYKVTLQTNVSSLSGSGMKVVYCLYYSQRSRAQDQKTVDFKVMLTLDYRTKGKTHFDENWTLVLQTKFCQNWEASITVRNLFSAEWKANNQKGSKAFFKPLEWFEKEKIIIQEISLSNGYA